MPVAASPGALITVAELALRLSTSAGESTDLMQDIINGASAAIAVHTGRRYVAEDDASITMLTESAAWPTAGFRVWDVRAVAGDATLVDADGASIGTVPAASLAVAGPFYDGMASRVVATSAVELSPDPGGSITLTLDVGFTSVPEHVREAALVTCMAWLRQDNQGLAGVIAADPGYEFMARPQPTWMLPMSARQLLRNDRIRGVG